ncbi:MAG TPA: hypothetical protein PKA60_02740 [Candidatus Paceibacterota bacterium]|nr:hypothetical protein [Candidatus Paceibacterota bacterium]
MKHRLEVYVAYLNSIANGQDSIAVEEHNMEVPIYIGAFINAVLLKTDVVLLRFSKKNLTLTFRDDAIREFSIAKILLIPKEKVGQKAGVVCGEFWIGRLCPFQIRNKAIFYGNKSSEK